MLESPNSLELATVSRVELAKGRRSAEAVPDAGKRHIGKLGFCRRVAVLMMTA
jgi:hypothetical protein